MLDIILPFWGEPSYLYKAVDSVLAQTSADWHLTIVDDCYPDDGVQKHFETLGDARVTYVRNETNIGITDNYRKGLTLAHAEYVMFMGCDDVMHPTFVATALDAASRWPQAEIIQPGVEVIDEADHVYEPLGDKVKQRMRPRGAEVLASGGSLATSLLHGDWLYWPSLVFRTSAIKEVEFLDGFPLVQDLGIVLEMLRRGARMLILDQVVFSYRRHAHSASSAKLLDGGRFAGERSFFALQAEKMDASGWRSAARAARAHITSRLYAVSLLPEALKTRRPAAIATLARHALNPGR